MNLLLPLILATLVSAEESRFSAVFEQGSESSCGPAAAAGLLSLYCGLPASELELSRILEPRGGANLGQLLELLSLKGVRARAFRLELAELDQALGRGLAPALLHYDRPKGHFALLLGAGEGAYVAADPARGLESLAPGELEARWSGGLILIDPDSLSAAGLALRSQALGLALGKRRLLSDSAAPPREGGGGGEGGAPGSEAGKASGAEAGRERLGFRGQGALAFRLGLDLELEALETGLGLGFGLRQELRFASGYSLGIELPCEAGLGTEPSFLLPGALGLCLGRARARGAWLFGMEASVDLPTALGFLEGRLCPAGRLGIGLGILAARIFDPASLGASLELGIEFPGGWEGSSAAPRYSLGLGLSATEALNETVFLRAQASLGLGWSLAGGELGAAAEIGGSVGIRRGSFGASLGNASRQGSEGGPPLELGLSWDSGGGS